MCSCTTLNRRRLLGLLPGAAAAAALAGPLAACGEAQTGPVAVRWGQENCHYCGMIIDEPRFAGELREPAGHKLFKFDDIGCAAMFLAQQTWAETPGTEFWVGDNQTGTWIDGRKAWYLSGAKSPMNYGFAAFAEKREGVVTFADFRKAVAAHGSTSRCDHPANGST